MPSAPVSFRSAAAFRRWLGRHHDMESELLIRLFKVHAAARGMTYRDALDEALCFGWIDGVRRGLDDDSFTIRFTPRKPKSYWSNVNVKRVNELTAEKRMHSAGLAAFQRHDPERAPKYSFEAKPTELGAAAIRRFRADKKAWTFFQQQAPSYQRTATFWIMTAKRPETRTRRLDTLIRHSARGERIPPLARDRK